MSYKIIRIHKSNRIPNKVVKSGLTLEEAQAHCLDPKTRANFWFDGYTKE